MLRKFKKRMRSAHEALLPRKSVARRSKRANRLLLEPLEPRLVLDGLVISEIMAVNDSFLADEYGAYSDWLEIHNPTALPVSLDGWYLKDSSAQWQFPDVTIDANDYLLVFASDSNLEPDPASELHTNFKLKGSGEYLGLLRPDFTPEYQFASYPQQYANLSYGLGSDLTTLGFFSDPSPGSANVGEPVDDPLTDVIITEIMYHPSSESDLEEYIELYNRGTQAVNLLGWQISDGVQFTFPNVTLNVGEYLVVVADEAAFNAKYPAVTNYVVNSDPLLGWTGRLSNGGEDIDLDDTLGSRVDSVWYFDQGDWAVREQGPLDHEHYGWVWSDEHDGGGKSLELINLAMTNNYGQNWAASIPDEGTPGVANSVAAADVAPIIYDVSHFPEIPNSADEVAVTARFRDELAGGATATLYYRDDGAGVFSTLAMLDEGSAGDVKADDGVFTALLPARPDGTVVEFYLEATDGANSRTYPAPTRFLDDSYAQATNLLYQVDDAFDPYAAWDPDWQPVYYMIMTEAERAELADISDDGNYNTGEAVTNAQMNATFISVDGTGTKTRYNAGIRNRGSSSRVSVPPDYAPNYRVNFAHDREWKDVTDLTINSRYPHSQVIGSILYGMAGIPAADAIPVQVRVNGTNLAPDNARHLRTYAALEPLGDDMIAAQLPDAPDGNLYQAADDEFSPERPDLRYEGENPLAYQNTYIKQTNEIEDDWQDLITLTDVINNSPAEGYYEALSQVLDVEQWTRYLATDTLIGNREGGLNTGVGDDYLLYNRGTSADPDFILMPHDLDTVMQLHRLADPNQSIFTFMNVTGLNAILSDPQVRSIYYASFLELIETVYNPETLNPILDQALGGFVPQGTIDIAKQFIIDRTAGVLAQIPQEFTISSSLAAVGGYPRSSLPVAGLDGTANAAYTKSVVVEGQLADWDPLTAEWSLGSNTGGNAEILLPYGSTWKYLDDGSDQLTAWYDDPLYDDTTWAEGPAQLGYGDGDESTPVGYIDADPGTAGTQKNATTYFRTSFEVTEPSRFTDLTLRLLYDDAGIVYLNGQEIYRTTTMGADPITYQTYSAASADNEQVEVTIDPAQLIDGTNRLAVEIHQTLPTSSDISFNLELEAIMPLVSTDEFITRGSTWRYLDDGSDGGTAADGSAWFAAPDHDDSLWAEDPGQLGYGDGDETTVISYGGDPNNKHITTYFRREFEVVDASGYIGVKLELLADDGAVVYLNGQEATRDNMPDPGVIDYLTLASSVTNYTIENNYVEYWLDPAMLVDGTNNLAVEVHQVTADSPDLGFDLKLDGLRAPDPEDLIGVPLTSGINRVGVETFDGLDGTGNLLESGFIDIYYDAPGTGATVPAGTIAANELWLAENGPYRVTGELVVAAGVTLEIEAGTNVFFDSGARLLVNGKLLAVGTEDALIHFTHTPSDGGSWGGLQFVDTAEDNLLQYAALGYGRTDNGMVGITNSTVTIDHSHFDNTDRRRIRFEEGRLTVTNSTFAEIFPGIAPTTDNMSEHIWGRLGNGLDQLFLLEGNYFGLNKGHNDMVDVDGVVTDGSDELGGGTFLTVLNNVFDGCGDDALDFEGDAYIEGNTFLNIRKDEWNTGSGNANGISAGDRHLVGHEYVMVRNKFYNVDHVAQVKEESFMTFVNNTVVDVAHSFLYFIRPGGSVAGRGALIDGNVIVNAPVYFEGQTAETDLTINRSTVPEEYHVYGVGNVDEEGRVADPANRDFSLVGGFGGGPNGQDMGAMIPPGVTIDGEPALVTTQTGATLTFGGPNYTHYKWRLDGGDFSAEQIIDTPVVLSGLADGLHTVDAIGLNLAGVWQDEADPSAESWTVDTALPGSVRINEVLAVNTSAVDHEDTFPDMIELHNPGTMPVDLTGMALSDDPLIPRRFVFPATTILGGGEYLVLYADSDFVTSGLHLGFGLDGNNGEAVYLYDTLANGAAEIDSIVFGIQLSDLSLGRTGRDGETWALTQPTLGDANVLQRTGDPRLLKINEWLADELVLFENDFIELYNADPLPVPLGGLYLTDNAVNQQTKYEIAPLSFVAGSGAVAFIADDDGTEGVNHTNFKLSTSHELMGLYNADGSEIDKIPYYPQTTDVSQGRSPNGSENLVFFELPTPGLPGPTLLTTTVATIAIDDVWAYSQTGAEPAGDWTATGYDDSGWSAGEALLYVEGSALPAPKNTPLTHGSNAYYFRTHFDLDADPADLTKFEISTVIDDGAVFSINGTEVYRLGMATGTVDYDTFANRTIGNANYEGPFALPTGALVQGDNVIAVEVHQTTLTSSDIVFGMTLDAETTTMYGEGVAKAKKVLDGLRITEMMYHPPGSGLAEFVEVQNISSQTLDITGVRFTDGVDFTFPSMTLAPDGYVLVVRDQAAFEAAYGTGLNVAGQYAGALSNDGENITLKLASPFDAAMLRFDYNDTWYPSTDGLGGSLHIIDVDAEPVSWTYSESWTPGSPTPGMDFSPLGVVKRAIFYNNSAWDDAAKGRTDDNAIATNKSALRPGQTAGFANYTSYANGINGIIIDVVGMPDPTELSDANFTFKVGNDNDPANWDLAPVPAINVRPIEGIGRSDRIVLTWNDHAIEAQWLEVTLLADPLVTGLLTNDVFYFGNAVGETGDSAADAKVDAFDVLNTRDNPHAFWDPAGIDINQDHNRDERVDAIDTLIVRNNLSWAMTELQLIDLTGKQWAVGSAKPQAAFSIINHQSSIINLHDAVLSASVEESSLHQEASAARMAWVYDFQGESDRPAKKNARTQEAVDRLLATFAQ